MDPDCCKKAHTDLHNVTRSPETGITPKRMCFEDPEKVAEVVKTESEGAKESRIEEVQVGTVRSNSVRVNTPLTAAPPTVRDRLRLPPDEKPNQAFRIVFCNSVTKECEDGSLKPAHNNLSIGNLNSASAETAFATAVEHHMDWGSRAASPFISLFRHQDHARNWANGLINRYGRKCNDLLTISLKELEYVYCLQQIVRKLKVPHKLQPKRLSKELLVLGSIPKKAIVHRESVAPRSTVEDVSRTLTGLSID